MNRFVLYRILGNDLPPRHQVGQTLANLEFMLRHEPVLPDCEKRWVVNRIVEPAAEKRIIALLRRHECTYLHLPFVEEEYAACRMDFERLPENRYFYHRGFRALSMPWKLRVIEWCYRERCRYLTNNNGARNAALEEGRKLADWILPFDGNCFFTVAAWEEIRTAAASVRDQKYLIVPLVRVGNNRDLLDPSFEPVVKEEPQVAFHRDALERFDPRLRYGTMDKANLLYKLNVPGIWLLHGPNFRAWEELDLSPSPEAGRYLEAGWVARLFSGQNRLEREAGERDVVRMQSILRIGNRIDTRIVRHRFSRQQLCYFSDRELATLRGTGGGDPGRRAQAAMLKDHADEVLRSDPLQREGWRAFAADLTTLVLHGHVSGESRYMRAAVDRIRAQLLDPESRRSPEQEPAGTPGGEAADGDWIMQFTGLVPALDALRLAEKSGALKPTQGRSLLQWSVEFLAWLKTDRRARVASGQLNHAGTALDLVSVAIALYADDVGHARRCLEAARMRIALQFRPDGSQVHETGRQDQLLNLELWAQLARIAPVMQLDLAAFRTGDGRGLATAAAALAATMEPDPALPAADRIRLDSVRTLLSGESIDAIGCFIRAAADGRA